MQSLGSTRDPRPLPPLAHSIHRQDRGGKLGEEELQWSRCLRCGGREVGVRARAHREEAALGEAVFELPSADLMARGGHQRRSMDERRERCA